MRTIRRTIVIIIFTVITFPASYAQSPEYDHRKFIEVTGSAEMTILPDEIELQVAIIAYDKISLDQAEEKFLALLKDNSISKDAVQIESINRFDWSYWWNYYYYYNDTKTYKVKLTHKTNFMKLAKDLHVQWVRNVHVTSSGNTETQRLRKEVKIQAVKAAKEKAGYLLESVGEQLGTVLSITEMPETSNPTYFWYNPNTNNSSTSNTVMNNATENTNVIENSQTIKLRYEVKVKFEIK